MSIIAKPYMQTGNSHLLPFDMNDPALALYLPLWYPHGDMTGSTIYSYDKNRHTCTVAGATWGSQGRTFDGVNAVITIGVNAAYENIFDGGGTISSWIYPRSDGEDSAGTIMATMTPWTEGWKCDVRSEAGGLLKSEFQQKFSTTNGTWNITDTVIPINTWTFYVLTYNCSNVANNPIIYINALPVALTESQTPVGTRVTDATKNFMIGALIGGQRTFDGIIGETVAFNSILSPAEISNYFQATKWRYQ